MKKHLCIFLSGLFLIGTLSFAHAADGVRIDLLYHHKSFPQTDDLVEHVDEPGPIEEAKFYIPNDPIQAFMKKELSDQQLLSHAQVFVDGKPVILVTPHGAQPL
jgi:hypothetical protein